MKYEKVALLFQTPNIFGTLWNQSDTNFKCSTFLTVEHSDIGQFVSTLFYWTFSTNTPIFHIKCLEFQVFF